MLKLLAIGLVAGFFGAIFGVGGGIVIVPLLVLLFAFDQRRAAATSLAAILVSSVAGAITYGFHGEVKVGAAALVGIPAVVRRDRRDDVAAAHSRRSGSPTDSRCCWPSSECGCSYDDRRSSS